LNSRGESTAAGSERRMRMLAVFHEAYRTPTRIRGHYMQVHKDGTLTLA